MESKPRTTMCCKSTMPMLDKQQDHGQELMKNKDLEEKVDIKMTVLRRLRAFMTVNGLLIMLGKWTTRLAGQQKMGLGSKLVCMYGATMVRMACLVGLIEWSARSKEKILGKARTKMPRMGDMAELCLRAMVDGVGECLTWYLAVKYFVRPSHKTTRSAGLGPFVSWYGGFVLKSFVFEVVFDFFHYWAHRICHEVPGLYQVHKSHHKWLHPSPMTTFQQHPLDLLMTNYLPNLASLGLLDRWLDIGFTNREYGILLTYKVFVEIAGHSGIETHATSFPQFSPLPKALNMDMHTNDHDLHHSSPSKQCNYSKRFVLWDKVFKTYVKS